MSARVSEGTASAQRISRLLGRVTVSDALLRESIRNGIAAKLFEGSVPLDVQRDWYAQTSTFLLWHPSFDECPEGCIVPQYIAVVQNEQIRWEHNGGNATPMSLEQLRQMLKGGAA